MIRNNTWYDHELCDSGGNACFWENMENIMESGVLERDCFCLGDCESVKYSQSATLKPSKLNDCTTLNLSPISLEHQRALILSKNLSPMKNITDWYETEKVVMEDYRKQMCEKIISNDKAILMVRLEGPTFMTVKRSLRVTFADKLGSIGGTLGLFSGFSLLAIMELIHWIFKIINSLIVSKK